MKVLYIFLTFVCFGEGWSGPSYHRIPGSSYHSVPGHTYHGVPGSSYHSVPGPSYHGVPEPTYHDFPKPTYDHVPGSTYHDFPKPTYDHVPGSTYHDFPKPTYDHVLKPTYDHVPGPIEAGEPVPTYDGGPEPTNNIPTVPFVSGGFRVNAQFAKWHAGLYKKTTNPYLQICGATIIAKRVVLSAAHCFTLDRRIPPASDYAVGAGKIYRPWNNQNDTEAQKRDVVQIHIPPRYQGNIANFQQDIAVVVVNSDFVYNAFVFAACLNFDPKKDENHLRAEGLGTVVGWGLVGANENPSQVLQGATLPSVPIDKCIEDSPAGFRSSITGDKICAGYSNGTAVCRGDSGGGLIFSTIDENFRRFEYVRGVVSTSPSSQDECNIYTWATFTHILAHEHFIKSIVPDVDSTCDPSNVQPLQPISQNTGATALSSQELRSVENIQTYLTRNGFDQYMCVKSEGGFEFTDRIR